jgi:hypothetical protein
MIIINLNKAKEITKNRLRDERKPLLQQQDIAFQRALEMGTETAEIISEKQRLRDITLLADSAENLEQLKQLSC